MSRLKYDISFYRSDLCREVAERLNRTLPKVSLEKCFQIVDESIKNMIKQDNFAVYQGLIEYVSKIAISQTQDQNIKNIRDIKRIFSIFMQIPQKSKIKPIFFKIFI